MVHSPCKEDERWEKTGLRADDKHKANTVRRVHSDKDRKQNFTAGFLLDSPHSATKGFSLRAAVLQQTGSDQRQPATFHFPNAQKELRAQIKKTFCYLNRNPLNNNLNARFHGHKKLMTEFTFLGEVSLYLLYSQTHKAGERGNTSLLPLFISN